MNTDTLATAIKIAELLEGGTPTPSGRRYVVVRGDRSGVFCGVLEHQDGSTVVLSDCRHIWYWSGASATDELATRGVANPEDCKFTAPAGRVEILDAITVLDCTPEAEASLRGVADWSQFK